MNYQLTVTGHSATVHPWSIYDRHQPPGEYGEKGDRTMTIYVVEIPHQMPPVAWAAKDEAELIAKVNADNAGVVYERTTVRELIDQYGEDDEQVADLARRHDPETVLYRADYLIGEGEYTPEEVSEYDAAVAAITHDLHSAMIFRSEAEAREALANDKNWDLHQGLQAREALRELLS